MTATDIDRVLDLLCCSGRARADLIDYCASECKVERELEDVIVPG